MQTSKSTGWLLIIGAAGVLIPYSILTVIFEYPDILRKETGAILTRFHDGGPALIWTWFAFAMAGLPLIPAYIRIGQQLEHKNTWVRTAVSTGVVGFIVQVIGLLRWTFVVPVIANDYIHAADPATQAAAVASFKTIHQFAGVLLGEHMGQILTISSTVILTAAFSKLKIIPRWVTILGYTASFIYLLAQAELFATVMPGFPVWELAGFIGSTLWLLWLICIGVLFAKR